MTSGSARVAQHDVGRLALLERTDIVVPIFNERDAAPALIERLRRSCPGARILFVDNGSTDGTVEYLSQQDGVELIRHSDNLGYGRSIRDGIAASERDLVAVIDADLEYAPEDLPRLLECLHGAGAGAAYGSRFLRRAGEPRRMSWHRQLGNRCVTLLFNALYGQRLTDLYTGIRAFRRADLAALRLTRSGFEFVLEVSARLARAGVTIAEVPVDYRQRSLGRSKMRHVRELAKLVILLIALRFDAPGARSPETGVS